MLIFILEKIIKTIFVIFFLKLFCVNNFSDSIRLSELSAFVWIEKVPYRLIGRSVSVKFD